MPPSRRRFLAALAPEATGAVVSPVECTVFAAAADDAAPADDSRAPTAPLAGAAEGTVPLVAGIAFDTASDDAAPADDSRAPTAPLSGVAEGTVPLAVDAAFDAAVSSAGAGALDAPPHRCSGENSTAGRRRCCRYCHRCRAR